VRTVFVGVIALSVAIAAVGCGGASDQKAEAPTIVAGFYPLAWVAEHVSDAGTHVVNLTPAVPSFTISSSPR
jgi:ABC-type Zn uptake system ZnuABC Zn-binding protein ZnuA